MQKVAYSIQAYNFHLRCDKQNVLSSCRKTISEDTKFKISPKGADDSQGFEDLGSFELFTHDKRRAICVKDVGTYWRRNYKVKAIDIDSGEGCYFSIQLFHLTPGMIPTTEAAGNLKRCRLNLQIFFNIFLGSILPKNYHTVNRKEIPLYTVPWLYNEA